MSNSNVINMPKDNLAEYRIHKNQAKVACGKFRDQLAEALTSSDRNPDFTGKKDVLKSSDGLDMITVWSFHDRVLVVQNYNSKFSKSPMDKSVGYSRTFKTNDPLRVHKELVLHFRKVLKVLVKQRAEREQLFSTAIKAKFLPN